MTWARGMRRVGERDVVVDRAVEQEIFLQHDADLAAQPGRIDLRRYRRRRAGPGPLSGM